MNPTARNAIIRSLSKDSIKVFKPYIYILNVRISKSSMLFYNVSDVLHIFIDIRYYPDVRVRRGSRGVFKTDEIGQGGRG